MASSPRPESSWAVVEKKLEVFLHRVNTFSEIILLKFSYFHTPKIRNFFFDTKKSPPKRACIYFPARMLFY